jgi:hypothetical protein
MTVESSNRASTSIDDSVLISEIAPAMLGRLKREGQTKGVLLALAFSFFIQMVSRQIGDQFSHVMPIIYATSMVALCGLILLPLYMRKRNVSVEIDYRRQHGKWRWER